MQNLSGLLKIIKWDSLDDPRVIGCRCLAYTIKCGFKFSIFTHLYEEIYILNYKGRISLLSKKWPVLSVHNNVVVQQLTWDLHPIKNSYVYIILLFSIKADIVVWYQYSTVEKSTSKYLTSTLLKSALNIIKAYFWGRLSLTKSGWPSYYNKYVSPLRFKNPHNIFLCI